MNFLPDLSGEALEAIFGFLDGFLLCKLWFCGSPSMCSMLSRHVKIFELDSERKKYFQWPKIVKYFVSLRSFSMTIIWGNDLTIVGGVDLKDLSRTLKHLVLMFGNGLLSLLKIHNLVDNLDESSTVELSSLDSKNIGTLFPELQTLKWGDIFWKGEWPKQIISQVPTLTHIRLPQTLISPSDIGKLPSTLTSLFFHAKSTLPSCDNSGLVIWPPHLRALDMSTVNQCHWLRNLPSELQILSYSLDSVTCQCLNRCGFLDYFSGESSQLPIIHRSDSSFSTSDEKSMSFPNLPKWPPNLIELHLPFEASLPSNFFTSLPKELRVLSMRNHEKINLGSFHLPAGLTSLEIGELICSDEVPKYLQALPRGLKSLSICVVRSSNGDALPLESYMHLLPKTLSNCRVNIKQPTIHLQEWPIFLERIIISIQEDGIFLKQAPFKFLKSAFIQSKSGSASGTRSILEGLGELKLLRELSIDRRLDVADLGLLECELYHLQIQTPVDLDQVPISPATKWHRSLLSLDLHQVNDDSFDENIQISFLNSLPSSLKDLTLCVVPRKPTTSSSYPKQQTPSSNYFTQHLVFPNLPQKLRHLKLDVNSFSNDGMQYLPLSLTSMTIAAHQSTYSFLDPINFSQSLNTFSLRLSTPYSFPTCPSTVEERIEHKRRFFETHPNLRCCAIPYFELPEVNDESWNLPKHGAIGRAVQTYHHEPQE